MSMAYHSRGPVIGRRGAIATSSYLATEAGLKILRDGGNAVDASLAAAAVLNVVEPMCSHLGGDAFMLHYHAESGTVIAINGSGPAPRALTPEHFAGADAVPTDGFLSSTIPGQVALWDEALTRFGTLSPGHVLREAIYYAEHGAPVSRDLANSIAGSARRLAQFPSSAAVFLPGGVPLKRGQLLRQPHLAQTLHTLARDGLRAFYEGQPARAIADFWQANGGVITCEDLAHCRARVLEPIQVTYRGLTVLEQPPVSQGHILLQSLALLEAFDLHSSDPLAPETLHLCLEANKLAHADKNRYTTDPTFHPFPQGLLSPQYARQRARLIDPNRAAHFPPPPGEPPAPQDTTYLCCVDGKGNAVSYIQSVFHGFGCGVLAPGVGAILNNRACGFSLAPQHVNFLQPGKKTVHTLNTYMVMHEGRPLIVGGTPGGDIQVQTNLQVLTGLIDHGLDPQQAVELPRWSRGEGFRVSLEERFPAQCFEGLRERGHDVTAIGPYAQGGRAQVITIDPDGILTAGSDPRCDGCALVF